MKRLLASLILSVTLILSSCGAVEGAIDHAGNRTEQIVTHATGEIGKLKTEVLEEISILKTETLKEVRETVEEMMPQVVQSILNADAVAFTIVSIVVLGGLVVLIALLLLLGAARTAYKRWQHPQGCSARQLDR